MDRGTNSFVYFPCILRGSSYSKKQSEQKKIHSNKISLNNNKMICTFTYTYFCLLYTATLCHFLVDTLQDPCTPRFQEFRSLCGGLRKHFWHRINKVYTQPSFSLCDALQNTSLESLLKTSLKHRQLWPLTYTSKGMRVIRKAWKYPVQHVDLYPKHRISSQYTLITDWQ